MICQSIEKIIPAKSSDMKSLIKNKLCSKKLLNYCDTLQLDSYGGWQRIDTDSGATGLIVFKILSVDLVVSLEVAFHVYQEDGYVNQLIPAAAAGLEYGTHIVEDTAALRCEIEVNIVAVLVGLQTWNFVGSCLTGPHT
jgi:hypothetical protein